MFRPELKDTGWETTPEVVFEISGENYQESPMLFVKKWEIERRDGTKTIFSEPSFYYNISEKKIATIINDSLMGILWESITVKELEEYFIKEIEGSDFNISKFRLEFPGDYSYEIFNSNCIYGWVHYKSDKKIETFRFQIGLDGSFKKC